MTKNGTFSPAVIPVNAGIQEKQDFASTVCGECEPDTRIVSREPGCFRRRIGLGRNLLSIVVPTRNRGDVSECLRHLLDTRHRPIEILVVDQSDNDETARSVRDLESECEDAAYILRCLRSETTGLSVARNVGISNAQGDWIGFVDDDCLVEPDWGEEVVRAFGKSARIGLVFGQIRAFYPPEKGRRTRISVKDSPLPKAFRSRISLVNTSAGGGGNSALSRRCLDSTGPFDENLGTGTDLPGGEDFELSYRALKAGYEVVYCPTASCRHKKRMLEEDYMKGERGYYAGRAAALVKHTRRGDPAAMVAIVAETFRRLLEIPYHFLVSRELQNVTRARIRASGFLSGVAKGWLKRW